MEILPLSIGLGLVVSLLFSEMFGLAAGGMVVPGYVALYMTPSGIVPVSVTIATGFATFAVVRGLSSVLIIFGKRRTVLMILVGYLFGAIARALLPSAFAAVHLPGLHAGDHAVIGYIIPGLIAIWLDRQGVIETVSTLLTASVVVRLLLVLVAGGALAS